MCKLQRYLVKRGFPPTATERPVLGAAGRGWWRGPDRECLELSSVQETQSLAASAQ